MSRYAMEWAKEQQPGNVAAKLVLVLLADRTGGTNCRVYDEQFLAETGLTAEGFAAAVGHLVDAGLLAAERFDRPFKRAGDQTCYKLQIPQGWRSRTSGPPPRRESSWSDAETAVYRLYDGAGSLLYVGITDDPQARFKHHASRQPWWNEVATREVVWCESRGDAEREEVIAIAAEYPRYNIHRATGRVRVLGAPAPQSDQRYVV